MSNFDDILSALAKNSNIVIGQINKDCTTVYGPNIGDLEKLKDQQEKNNNEKEEQTTVTVDDAIIIKAMAKLMELKDENGEYLLQNSAQLDGVYRVLVDECHYPSSFKTFIAKIATLDIDSLRVAFDYDTLRRINGIFTKPLDQWTISKFDGKRPNVYWGKYNVAQQFKQLLENENKDKNPG